MRKVICIICLLLLVLVIGGCATIMHGPTQKIRVTSNPPGATVTTTTFEWIKTPGTFELSRSNSTELTANLYGYETTKQKIKCGLSLWIFGDAVGGFYPWTILGIEPYITLMIVDFSTSSVGTLSPTEVHFEMVKKKI